MTNSSRYYENKARKTCARNKLRRFPNNGVCVVFTLNHYFYPAISVHPDSKAFHLL